MKFFKKIFGSFLIALLLISSTLVVYAVDLFYDKIQHKNVEDQVLSHTGGAGIGGIAHDSLAGVNQAGAGITNGHISAAAQSISGDKTFANSVIVTEDLTVSGTMKADGSSGGCLMMRDTDDLGWTECKTLDGVMTCAIDADGICD